MMCTVCGDTGLVRCPWCSDYPPGQCKWCDGTGQTSCGTLACFVRARRHLPVADIVRATHTDAHYQNVSPQTVRRILRRRTG